MRCVCFRCGTGKVFGFASGVRNRAIVCVCNVASGNCGGFAGGIGGGEFCGQCRACRSGDSRASRICICGALSPRFALAQSASALLSAADYAPAARTRLVCGAGFLQYPEMLQNARAELSQIAPVPNAAAVAEIAATMLIEGETLPPEKCTPRYIRRKIAQTIAERAAAKL